MKIKYKKQFLKDLSKLPISYRKTIEGLVFETIPKIDKSEILHKVSKLKGYRHYYKIRVGEYRIGLYIEDDNLEFKRVLNRKDIYRYFP